MADDPQFPFEYANGATPLDPNEVNGLRITYISTQAELNELEQANILKAQVWAQNRKAAPILDDTFLRNLHLRMFGDVWKWAGKYRLSDKSIGPSWHQVPTEIIKLLGDVEYWVANKTYSLNEIGARFHHRLVLIHAFPNGNGRHARLMTDLFLLSQGNTAFSWGAKTVKTKLELEAQSSVRIEYITALREADEKRYDRLMRFVRS